MEPGLQPSFTFPSRNQTHNLAQGLLNQAAATQLPLIQPKRATDIDLWSTLESPLTVPKTLDKDTIDPKPQLPVATPIYVQPGLAEGMTHLAQLTKADVEMTQLLSANNALKRGNYRSAEHVLGRQLTAEEISNRTITPLVRSSEANPNTKIHLSEQAKQLGAPLPGESKGNYEERLRAFRHADESFINTIALHLNIDPQQVSELKSTLNFDGNSVLGFVKSTPEHRRQVIDLFTYHWKAWKGKTKEEKREILKQRSILEGEGRPLYSAGKKKKSEAKLKKDVLANSINNPYGPYGSPEEKQAADEKEEEERKHEAGDSAAVDLRQEPRDPFYNLGVWPEFSNDVRGAPMSIEEQVSQPIVPQAPPISDILGPQGVQQAQVAVPMDVLKDEIRTGVRLRHVETKEREEKGDINPVLMEGISRLRPTGGPVTERQRKEQLREAADNTPFKSELREEVAKRQRQRETGYVPVATAPIDPDEIGRRAHHSTGTENRIQVLEDADMKLQYQERHPEMLYSGPTITIPEVNLINTYVHTTDRAMEREANRLLFTSSLSSHVTIEDLQRLTKKYERAEPLSAGEVSIMKEFVRLLQGRKSVAEGHEDEPAPKKRNRGNQMEESEGGSLKRRRTLKKQVFKPQGKAHSLSDHLPGIGENERWVPQTSSLDPRGGVVSGQLMRSTGVNAVPISAQLQVSNTHQLYESPLLDWVKHPNSVDDVRPDIIPISQYAPRKPKTVKKLGVNPAPRKVTFGGYLIDHHKLMHENMLSVMHPSGNKVKGLKNETVSNGLRDAIHAVLTGSSINKRRLNAADKLKLQTLLKKSKADVDTNGMANVTPHKQLQLIMGEIDAGNDDPRMKTQLRKLLPILKSAGKLSATQVESIKEHFL